MAKKDSVYPNKIDFGNRQRKERITKEIKALCAHAIDTALAFEEVEASAEISVTFVGERTIREMNRDYRGVDRVTDVLSFPLLSDEYDETDLDGGLLCLGDIVICPARARQQAEEFGHSFEREMAFLAVHSTLHLLGYDHETSEEDERDMFFRQEKILEKAGILRI